VEDSFRTLERTKRKLHNHCFSKLPIMGMDFSFHVWEQLHGMKHNHKLMQTATTNPSQQ